ncbi:MAG: hypothetical protein GW911_16040 [Armatimonadetes bacterium]|nr:hypothetical protein [Armatimonadota bacterium]NCO91144.1 hypothetical protein [Armatimonadota bacterium]NCP29430.1 hypothetical protein [Armatimonadota bacterium]NDK13537.1 hypothetical protein [Armatimonadota bacterium]
MSSHTKAWAGVFVTAALVVAARSSWAIPAYGRQFNEKCTTCHTPQPPRLNNVGLTFQRLGYRFLDTDDNGKLTYRAREQHNVGEDLSFLIDLKLSDSSADPWTIDLHEVEIMGSGSAGTNNEFAYFAEYVLAEDDKGAALEDARVQYAHGDPAGVFTVRAGQFIPMLWRKANTGRLTTSRPLFVDTRAPRLTGAGGSRSMVRLRERHQGIEFGYALNKVKDGAMSNTFFAGTVSKGLLNGRTEEGSDTENSKDLALQVMHLYGDRNTVSAFYWDGKDGAGDAGGTKFTQDITRLALVGNHVIAKNADVLYGYLDGSDDVNLAGVPTLDSKSHFLELDYTFREATEDTGPLTAVLRYDRFRQDNYNFATATAATATTKALTVGLAGQESDNLLWSLEYHKIQDGDRLLTAELKLVY